MLPTPSCPPLPCVIKRDQCAAVMALAPSTNLPIGCSVFCWLTVSYRICRVMAKMSLTTKPNTSALHMQKIATPDSSYVYTGKLLRSCFLLMRNTHVLTNYCYCTVSLVWASRQAQEDAFSRHIKQGSNRSAHYRNKQHTTYMDIK